MYARGKRMGPAGRMANDASDTTGATHSAGDSKCDM